MTHDARGNVTAIGGTGYANTAENRLHTRGGASYTWWDHDGGNLVAEIHHPNNSIQRRWVHGPGVDEPLVQYEGSGTTDRRWLHADERGSIVAISDSAGTVTAVNRYDEYGTPATGNSGRFQYTGQPWLPEAGLYYSRARMYHPQLGRFLQTDPIGYGDGMNMYGYVSRHHAACRPVTQPVRPSARLAKWASMARRMPSAIWDWPSGEWM